jgi:hypothetical protein
MWKYILHGMWLLPFVQDIQSFGFNVTQPAVTPAKTLSTIGRGNVYNKLTSLMADNGEE